MDLADKLKQLKQIYVQHDRFFSRRQVACRKFCDACCTCNVTLTTLEGYFIASALGKTKRLDLLPALHRTLAGRRFQPQLTINALAERCMRNETVPEETADPQWGRCPFLDQALCSIYPVRPFGCRAMLSTADCRRSGFATMDELALTVNNIFLQAIEHLDRDGLSGNLADVMQFVFANTTGYDARGSERQPAANGLIRNRPIKMLMIPPEHRAQARPLLRSLRLIA